MATTPALVMPKLKELVAEGKDRFIIAELLTEAGHACTARQIKRWKKQHGLRCRWRGTDGELDAVVKQLRDDGEIGMVCVCYRLGE